MSQTEAGVYYNAVATHNEYLIVVAKEGPALACPSLMGCVFLPPFSASPSYAPPSHRLREGVKEVMKCSFVSSFSVLWLMNEGNLVTRPS